MLSNAISRLILLTLIHISLFASTDIELHVREGSGVDLTSGSKVTDTPYGYYVSSFGKNSIKAYNQIDLSAYPNKKLLVGYGIYDIQDDNCRYLDVPSNKNMKLDFEKIFTFGDSTYAISRNKYTYTECANKAAQYSGLVWTPNNANEMAHVTDKLGLDKDMWVGYTRADCSTNYKNNENYEQSYENYLFTQEICSETKKYTKKEADEYKWHRVDKDEMNYCPIKINSLDYLRPIKACMPWWKVERTLKLDKNDNIFEYNGKKYDMRYIRYIMDYPEDKVICSQTNLDKSLNAVTFRSSLRVKKIDNTTGDEVFEDTHVICSTSENILVDDFNTNFSASCVNAETNDNYDFVQNDVACTNTDPIGGISTATCKQKRKEYEITCNTYDSIKESSLCIDDITRDICRVNECQGYIQNTCTKKDTYSPFKDYDVGYIMVDGIEKRIKTKQNKEIHTYSCPKPLKTESQCLTKEAVSVFPAHCPGSKCDELSECLLNKTKTFEECQALFPCEKNYGTVDDIIRDGQGKAIALGGTCADGEKIQATIEYKSTNKRRCVSYEEVVITTPSTENCESEATSTTHSVFASITADDAYSLDDRCVRTNNLEESRPEVNSVFDYETKGFFKTSIQKVYSNKTTETHETTIEDGYLLTAAQMQLKVISDFKTGSVDTAQLKALEAFCNQFDENWINKRVLELGDGGTLASTIAILQKSNTLAPYDIIAISSDKAKCDTYKIDSGLDQDITNTVNWSHYDFSSVGISQSSITNRSYCIVGGSGLSKDLLFKSIKRNSSTEIEFKLKANTDKPVCTSYSQCLSAKVDTHYANDTEVRECVISTPAEVDEQIEPSSKLTDTPSRIPEITETSGTFAGNINGYTDVFAVQEYTEGDFGYISNYDFILPQNNIIKIDNKEISPIIQQKPIDYEALYDDDVTNHSQRTKNKSPTIIPSSYEGYVLNYSPDILTQLHEGYLGNVLMDDILTHTTTIIAVLFGKTLFWGWYDIYYNINQPYLPDSRYVENVYGFDRRVIEDKKLVWNRERVATGTMRKDDYLSAIEKINTQKKDRFLAMGFDESTIDSLMTHGIESSAKSFGFPGKKKKFGLEYPSYKTDKEARGTREGVDITKKTNTVYMGAVNSLAIVVPYLGAYEIKAFDKNDNLLASKIVKEEAFIDNIPSSNGNVSQTHANVQLATSTNFNISPAHNDSKAGDDCLASNYVEWGGGVSGAYYEQGTPDLGPSNLCKKSNDTYVKEHSATRLTVKATNSDEVFDIQLKKPMPYPNRVILVNLKQQEFREYQCFTEVNKCLTSTNATYEE